MKKTRLTRRQEQQTKKTVIVMGGVIVVLIAIILIFGVPLLINLSLFVGKLRGDESLNQVEQAVSYIPAPILNQSYTATNSATVSIAGIASKDQVVKLYLNREYVDEVDVNADNKFIFTNITLTDGENVIEAIAKDGKNESDYSSPLEITYLEDPPKLEIAYPTDQQTVSKNNNPINIHGQTDQNVKVTVNGFWAILETNGRFRYDFPLKDGENKIMIVATDAAGNTTQKEVSVTLAP